MTSTQYCPKCGTPLIVKDIEFGDPRLADREGEWKA